MGKPRKTAPDRKVRILKRKDKVRNAVPTATEGKGRRRYGKYRARPSSISSDEREMFPTEVTDNEAFHMFERDETFHALVVRKAEDAVNKWCEIECTTDQMTKEVETVFGHYGIKAKLVMAAKMSDVFRFTTWLWNWAVWPEPEGTPELELKPGDVKGLFDINLIPSKWVDAVNYIEDPRSPDYGDIKSIGLSQAVGKNTDLVTYDRSWFMHVYKPGLDGTANGLPLSAPLHNIFKAKETMTYCMQEGFYSNSVPAQVLYHPDNPTVKEWARTDFKDMGPNENINFPGKKGEHYTYERIGFVGNTLNPQPYMDQLWDQIVAGAMVNKTVLTGPSPGHFLGSEYAYKFYYSIISDVQTAVLEPWIREIIKTLQYYGILTAAGEIKEIRWNPLFEETAKEKAEVLQIQSNSLQAASSAMLNFRNLGFVPTIDKDEDELLMVHPDGGSIKMTGLEISGATPAPTGGLPLAAPTAPPVPTPGDEIENGFLPGESVTRNRTITEADWSAEDRKWDMEDPWVETDFHADLLAAMNRYRDEWLARLESVFPEQIQNAETPEDAIKVIVGMSIKGTYLDKCIETWLAKSYVDGANQTEVLLGAGIDLTQLDDPMTREYIAKNMPLLSADLKHTVDDIMYRGLQDGVRAGEGYKKIARRISNMYGDKAKNMPATVHKIVHGARNIARLDAFKSAGEMKVMYITAGDGKVRDDHQHHGEIFDVGDPAMQFWLNEFGCRCMTRRLTDSEKEMFGVV